MGVDIHVYTVYGIEIPWNEQLIDDYDDIYKECTADLVMDGMGGNYIILGKILFGSQNFRWNDEVGDSRKQYSISELPAIEAEYRKNFTKWFPEHVKLLDGEFKLMTLTHYS